MTRPAQNNDTQRWILTNAGTDMFTIRQKSNGRFVDAHEHSGEGLPFGDATVAEQRHATLDPSARSVPSTRSAKRSNGRSWTPTSTRGKTPSGYAYLRQNDDTQRWVVLLVRRWQLHDAAVEQPSLRGCA